MAMGMQWRLPEGDPKGSRAGRGRLAGHTYSARARGTSGEQDAQNLAGAVVTPHRGQRDTHPEKDGPPVAKAQGTLGTPEAVWGVFLLQADHISTLENSQGSRAFHPSQPQQSLLTLCTHRTSGLMISRPGGRGYKARILSHKAMIQGSITASGLQVRHSGYSNIIPPGSSPATPACAQQPSPQSPHAIPFQLQVWEETYLSHSKHSLSRAQPLTPEEDLQCLNSTSVVTKSLSHHSLCPVPSEHS